MAIVFDGESFLELDAGLFLVIAILCLYESTRSLRCFSSIFNRTGNVSNWERDGEGRTPGTEMRCWVQSFLAISSFSRCFLLLAMAIFDGSPGVALQALPTMFFLTTFSILGYFWAQLSMALEGKSSRGSFCLLLSGLSLLWIGFFSAIVAMIITPDASWVEDFSVPSRLRSAILYLIAFAHFVVFCAILFFGMRIAAPTKRRKDLLLRTVVLGTICCTALMIRCVTCLMFASGAFDRALGASSRDYVYSTDALYLVVVELLPGATILFLTRRKAKGRSLNSSSNNSVYSPYSSIINQTQYYPHREESQSGYSTAHSSFVGYGSAGKGGYAVHDIQQA